MKTVEINEMKEIIRACPKEINLLFIGDTGIGKTSVIEDLCREDGYYLHTLILSQLEASDSLGIPVKSEMEFDGKNYPTLKTAIPEWVFKLANEEKPMLFLDEFLCGEPSVMNSFLNFLSQKRIGDIDLSHVKVVAATNIGKYTYDLDNNMLTRFCMFYTINTSYQSYIKDTRFMNNYRDDSIKDGPIFETRQLAPRCQYQLKGVNDEYFPSFFEGFTNRKYISYHVNAEINQIIAPFVCENTISDIDLRTMIPVLLKSMPEDTDWSHILLGFNSDIFINKNLYEELFLNKSYINFHEHQKVSELVSKYVDEDMSVSDEHISNIASGIAELFPRAGQFDPLVSQMNPGLKYNEKELRKQLNDILENRKEAV